MQYDAEEILQAHLNVSWLRPESALWDTIASMEMNKLDVGDIDIDLGSGNGIFSFITCGGRFSLDFDWFVQSDLKDPDKNVFDHFNPDVFKSKYITRMPVTAFKVAFDKKKVLLDQAKTLNWYTQYVEGDISETYPFEDGSAQKIFSNVLYFLADPSDAFAEIRRVLAKKGKLVMCMPDPRFLDFCPTFKSHLKEFSWLKRLNRNRTESMKTYYSYSDIKGLAGKHDFKIIHHSEYLSRELLLFWDIGLRPIIRPLLRMIGHLNDQERNEIKKEWLDILYQDLSPIIEREISLRKPKGFHLCVLEKR